MNLLKKAALALVVLGFSGQVLAEGSDTVTLISLDGTVVLKGELQALDQGFYHLVVVGMGLVLVAEELVECQSETGTCEALISNS